MDSETKEQSLKVIALRDEIIDSNKDSEDPQFIRLRLEKKLRDDYQKSKDYGKYLKNGRVDKIDARRRHKLVTPIKDLQDAYYEKYRPRKDRDNEDSEQQQGQAQNKRIKQTKPTTESFYDDDDAEDTTTPAQNSQSPGIMNLKPSSYSGILPPTSASSNSSSIPGFQPSPSPTLQALLAQTTANKSSPYMNNPLALNQIPPPPSTQPPSAPSPSPMAMMSSFGMPSMPSMPFNLNNNMFTNQQPWFNQLQQSYQGVLQQQPLQQQQQPQQQQQTYQSQPGMANPWGFPGIQFNQLQFQQTQAQQQQQPATASASASIDYGGNGPWGSNSQSTTQQQSQQRHQAHTQQGPYQQNKQLQPY